jgi:Membrane transporters of cations and cationic drugs
MNPYVWLAGAVVSEVIGTTILKLSDGLENTVFGITAIGMYIISFYFVSLALTELPVGLVYATWSAIGIVGLALIGIVYFNEPIDAAAVVGFVLVTAGIVLLNVYSDAYSPA